MQMVQVEFVLQPEGPYSETEILKVVWVDKSWNLKHGDLVTFKGEDARKWLVKTVYTTVQEALDLDKKWGLELPKSQRTER